MEDRRILIDTSVVIDHFRKKNKQRSLLYELSKENRLFLSAIRVRQKISSQFQVLRRSADKARKSMNIKHIQNFRNAVRRDASAPEM
ncbi:MAG: hypothetical protein U9R02_05640 [Thermodesulfobacteriota bacterium]|nr:hypothetical protein [Thermodesulfobacteriota bacterium]